MTLDPEMPLPDPIADARMRCLRGIAEADDLATAQGWTDLFSRLGGIAVESEMMRLLAKPMLVPQPESPA